MAKSVKLTKDCIDLFAAVWIRNEEVYENFKGSLKAEHFGDNYLKVLYHVTKDFYDTNERAPLKPELVASISEFLPEFEYSLEEEDHVNIGEFLEFAYDPDTYGDSGVTSDKLASFVHKVGQKLLLNVFSSDTIAKLKAGGIADASQFVNVLQQATEQAEGIANQSMSIDPSLTFSEGWDRQDTTFINPTGLKFLDKYMGGGTKAKEIYGIMAPYGTCKTTLAVMLWCNAAKDCAARLNSEDFKNKHPDKANKVGLSFLVTYEAPLNSEIRHRALAYMGTIARESLEAMGSEGMSALNGMDPKDYEQWEFSSEIKDDLFRSEKQRALDAISILNKHTVCLDMTGDDPNFPNAGSGGIAEIKKRIKAEIKSRNDKEKLNPSGAIPTEYYVESVLIDYWGAMLERDQSLTENKNSYDDSKALSKHVLKAKNQLAIYFDCHVWIFHQLTGQANSYSPMKELHHTDAKGCSSFAENLDFAIQFGNLTVESIGKVHCSKHRRTGKMASSLIKVEGRFNRVVVPDNYMIDGRGKLVEKSAALSAGEDVAPDEDASFDDSFEEGNQTFEQTML